MSKRIVAIMLTVILVFTQAFTGNVISHAEGDGEQAISSGSASENASDSGTAAGGVEISETNFPDEIFRDELSSTNYDSNSDGVLSQEEISNLTNLSFSNQKIADFTGISHLTELQSLYVSSDTKLTTIDLSANTKLDYLYLYECNKLTSIDLSSNVNLENVTVYYCAKLASINLKGLTKLKSLNVSSCALTELDVTELSSLETLTCPYNKLTALDLTHNSNLTNLACSGNSLTELDIKALTKLTQLDCCSNKLKTIDLNSNSALTELRFDANEITNIDLSPCPSLTTLSCGSNSLTALDVSGEANLTFLYCQSNNLGNINLSNCTKLESLYVDSCNLYTLDVSKLTELTTLSCGYNYLMSLDLSNNKDLTSVSDNMGIMNNQSMKYTKQEDGTYLIDLTSIPGGYDYTKYSLNEDIEGSDVVPTITEKGLSFSDKPNGAIYLNYDLSNGEDMDDKYFVIEITPSNVDVVTEKVEVEINETNFPDANFRQYITDTYDTDGDGKFVPADITGLPVSDCDIKSLKGIEFFTNLTNLYCWGNELTSLDISHAPNLQYLNCDDNQITGINLSNATELMNLYCSYNKITSLDLASCEALQTLSCYDNNLNSLDLSNNKELTSLTCYSNSITNLDLSNNTKLQYIFVQDIANVDISKCLELTNISLYNTSRVITDFTAYKKLESISVSYSMSVYVTKNASGEYVADSSALANLNPADFATSNSNSAKDSFNSAEKTATGWKWSSTPFSENYDSGIQQGEGYSASYDLTFDENVSLSKYSSKSASVSLTFYDISEVSIKTVEINETNFPDKDLREFLQSRYGSSIKNVDVTTLYIDNADLNIQDWTGIELFDCLKNLNIWSNDNISSVTIKSDSLVSFYAQDCSNLTKIDLSGCSKIKEYSVYSCSVTEAYLPSTYTSEYSYSANYEATAVQNASGDWVLDIASGEALNTKRIYDSTDELTDGRFVWKSAEDIPVRVSYRYAMTDDVENIDDISSYNSYMQVDISVTNNAPAKPKNTVIEINETNFPDEAFRNYVKKEYANGKDTVNASSVSYLSLYGWNDDASGITDVTGIEQFTYLTSLNISNVPITKLDLSKNTLLTSIYMNSTSLTSLDVSNNVYLDTINVTYCSLTDINISNNVYLRELELYENSLSEIDLSKNVRLKTLNINNNALSSIDLSATAKLQSLSVCNNKLKSLDISKLTGLTKLEINGNKFESKVDFTNNTNLKELYFDTCNDKLPAVDLSAFSNLERLGVYGNVDVTLDLNNCTKLNYLYISSTKLMSEYDFSKCEKLSELYIYGDWENHNKISKLVLPKTNLLKNVTLNNIKLDELDAANLKSLTVLEVYTTGLSKLSVSGDVALKTLYCQDDNIASLDVSDCVALQYFNCSSNKLTSLDVSNNLALKSFYCYNNPITSIDVSKNKAMLEELNCSGMALTSLDVSENTELGTLDASNQTLSVEIDDITGDDANSENTAISSDASANSSAASSNASENKADASGNLSAQSLGLKKKATTSTAKGSVVLNLSKYGKFDSSKVSDLSSGTLVSNGIKFDSADDVPATVTYTYNLNNKYKLTSGNLMTVTLKLKGGNNSASNKGTLSVNKSSATIYTGNKQNTVKLIATAKNSAGESCAVKWSSTNPKVAKVSSTGVVTAVKAGTVYIKATCAANGRAKSISVTVKNPKITVKGSTKVKRGKSTSLKITTNPKNSKVTLVKLDKKSAKIVKATLKNGKTLIIKGKKKGKVKLTLKCGGASKKITVTVK